MSRVVFTDLYRVLGVGPEVDAEGLRDAYRAAARRAHPDAGGSHEEFVVLDLARRVLSDPAVRSAYDACRDLDRVLRSSAGSAGDAEAARAALGQVNRTNAAYRLPAELRDALADLVGQAASVIQRSSRSGGSSFEFDDEFDDDGLADDDDEDLDDEDLDGGDLHGEDLHGEDLRGEDLDDEDPEDEDLDDDPDVVDDEVVDDEWLRHLDGHPLRELLIAVRDLMLQWPAIRDQLANEEDLAVTRQRLTPAYAMYRTLRATEDVLVARREVSGADVVDLELELGVLSALSEVADTIRTSQLRAGRNYSLQSDRSIVRRRRLVRRWVVERGGNPRVHPFSRSSQTTTPDASNVHGRNRCEACAKAAIIGSIHCWRHASRTDRELAEDIAGEGRCCCVVVSTGSPCRNRAIAGTPTCTSHQSSFTVARKLTSGAPQLAPSPCERCARPALVGVQHCLQHADEAERELARGSVEEGRCCSTTKSGAPCNSRAVFLNGLCGSHSVGTDDGHVSILKVPDVPRPRSLRLVGGSLVGFGALSAATGAPWPLSVGSLLFGLVLVVRRPRP